MTPTGQVFAFARPRTRSQDALRGPLPAQTKVLRALVLHEVGERPHEADRETLGVGLQLLRRFRCGFHVSDRNLNRQVPAPNVLLSPGHDCPYMILVERLVGDVQAFRHRRS